MNKVEIFITLNKEGLETVEMIESFFKNHDFVKDFKKIEIRSIDLIKISCEIEDEMIDTLKLFKRCNMLKALIINDEEKN